MRDGDSLPLAHRRTLRRAAVAATSPLRPAKSSRLALLGRNRYISRGDGFIAQLRVIIEKEKPDLVWVNPLHSFAGCDISDAQEMGRFLRWGLNGS